MNVCVTGAAGFPTYALDFFLVSDILSAGQIAYSLVFNIAQGRMLGARRVNLRLLDLPALVESLNGLVMELQDCAFPLLNGTRNAQHSVRAYEAYRVQRL